MVGVAVDTTARSRNQRKYVMVTGPRIKARCMFDSDSCPSSFFSVAFSSVSYSDCGGPDCECSNGADVARRSPWLLPPCGKPDVSPMMARLTLLYLSFEELLVRDDFRED